MWQALYEHWLVIRVRWWSSQGVLQQAFRIERVEQGQVVGVGMEWRDVPGEGA